MPHPASQPGNSKGAIGGVRRAGRLISEHQNRNIGWSVSRSGYSRSHEHGIGPTLRIKVLGIRKGFFKSSQLLGPIELQPHFFTEYMFNDNKSN